MTRARCLDRCGSAVSRRLRVRDVQSRRDSSQVTKTTRRTRRARVARRGGRLKSRLLLAVPRRVRYRGRVVNLVGIVKHSAGGRRHGGGQGSRMEKIGKQCDEKGLEMRFGASKHSAAQQLALNGVCDGRLTSSGWGRKVRKSGRRHNYFQKSHEEDLENVWRRRKKREHGGSWPATSWTTFNVAGRMGGVCDIDWLQLIGMAGSWRELLVRARGHAGACTSSDGSEWNY